MSDDATMSDDAARAARMADEQLARPVIKIVDGERPRIIREAADALRRIGVPIYRRGQTLVRPARAAEFSSPGIERPDDALVLTNATTEWLSIRLCDAAEWRRYDARQREMRPCDPPSKVASGLLAIADELELASLRGIAQHPVLRPNGTLASQPGYDEETGLLLDFDPMDFAAVSDEPEAAIAALRTLEQLLRHFLFTDPASKAVALSALVTAVARPTLPQAPMHCFDAPTAGSGKSLLAHTAAILATGRTAPVLAVGHHHDEAEKRLDAALLAGDPILVLDNIERPLQGERLCQIISEPSVRVRRLGASELVTVPCTSLVLATGNNLRLRGDLTRRAVICRVDPGIERPELRDFDQDLLHEVATRRSELVVAALTILNAYAAHGRPDVVAKPLGGFETWSRTVRDALIHAGADDPVKTMNRLRTDDPELETLRSLFAAWNDVFEDVPQFAKEVVAAAKGNEALRDALQGPAGRDGDSPTALGNYLKRHQDQVIDDKRLMRVGIYQGAAKWCVIPTRS